MTGWPLHPATCPDGHSQLVIDEHEPCMAETVRPPLGPPPHGHRYHTCGQPVTISRCPQGHPLTLTGGSWDPWVYTCPCQEPR